MATIRISNSTRLRLLSAAATGERIEPWLFNFTRTDKELQTELVRIAEGAKNQVFFACLREFLQHQEDAYRKQHGTSGSAPRRSETQGAGEERQPSKAPRRLIIQKKKAPKEVKPSVPPSTTAMKISPNYSPTGISFDEFLRQRGFHYSTSSIFVRFVSGGAVDSNRRRH